MKKEKEKSLLVMNENEGLGKEGAFGYGLLTRFRNVMIITSEETVKGLQFTLNDTGNAGGLEELFQQLQSCTNQLVRLQTGKIG